MIDLEFEVPAKACSHINEAAQSGKSLTAPKGIFD